MPKKLLLIITFCTFMLQTNGANANYNVIPLPQRITLTQGKSFLLSSEVQILCGKAFVNEGEFLSEYIQELTGIKLLVNQKAAPGQRIIKLETDAKFKGDEAYKIIVTNKEVRIIDKTSTGIFYGI